MTQAPAVPHSELTSGIVMLKLVSAAGMGAEFEAKTLQLLSGFPITVLVLVLTMETLATPV